MVAVAIRLHEGGSTNYGSLGDYNAFSGRAFCVPTNPATFCCHRCGSLGDGSRCRGGFNCGVIRTIQEQKSPHTADGAQDEHTNDEPQDQSTSYERAIIHCKPPKLIQENLKKETDVPYPAIKNQ